MLLKATGKLPSGKYKEQLQRSPQYRNGAFQNVLPTPMKQDDVSYWTLMRAFFKKYPHTSPSFPLPSVKTPLDQLPNSSLVWFGHSSYLLRLAGKNILVDPVFSGHASPFSFMVKAFDGADVYRAADMPVIDYLLITHDHYDHLDYQTIRGLQKKVRSVVCSLGVGVHLKYWGIDEHIITELDWWNGEQLDEDIHITATPARHFSGRTTKRGQSLWSSFVIKTKHHSIYAGGDSGYDTHFKEIGDKFEPFDLAILEAGQYNAFWPLIHMMPEEMVDAALDLQASAILPVHWGKFKLGMHPWNEPVQRVLAKVAGVNATRNNLPGLKVLTPRIGEVLKLNGQQQFEHWWEAAP